MCLLLANRSHVGKVGDGHVSNTDLCRVPPARHVHQPCEQRH